MTGIFRANNPSGNAILFLYAIVLKLPIFLSVHKPQVRETDGVLYKYLLHLLQSVAGGSHAIYAITVFILLYTQAISLNTIVNSLRLHRSPNYLTGMSYLLITSLFTEWYALSAPLMINSFILFIFSRLAGLYTSAHPKATVFNIGFALGVSAFIYFPSLGFLLLVIAGIALARPFRLQEWFTGIMGIAAPFYFFAAFLFLTYSMGMFRFPMLHFSYPYLVKDPRVFAAIFLLAFTAVTGGKLIIDNLQKQIVQTKKNWQLLFLYLLLAATLPFVNSGENLTYLILFALPLSPLIAAAFFYPAKRIIPLIIHWALFALCVGTVFSF